MKGVILAGGTGTRLDPITRVTNKHLIPVYDRPMIMWPLNILIEQGIKDIMIVSGKGHAGHFLELLGSGASLGIRIQYAVQEEAGGVPQALGLAEDFADQESVAVILGDNIYEHNPDLSGFIRGARIFLKHVPDPRRFGVVTLKGDKVIRIVEKPEKPETNFAMTGCFIFDSEVFDIIKGLKPSSRGELEITDVCRAYMDADQLEARMIDGFWSDAGTIESLYRASTLVRQKVRENQKAE